MKTIIQSLPTQTACPQPSKVASLRNLPANDPINSYPLNIQKVIYLLAGIVKRIQMQRAEVEKNQNLH